MERGAFRSFEQVSDHSCSLQVKKSSSVYKDPRYDVVGSSSLREELFNTYIKTLATAKVQAPVEEEDGMIVEKESKESRRERALKEREQKVKAEQGRVSMNIEKSRQGMNQEEGERMFKCVLSTYRVSWLRLCTDCLPFCPSLPERCSSTRFATHR